LLTSDDSSEEVTRLASQSSSPEWSSLISQKILVFVLRFEGRRRWNTHEVLALASPVTVKSAYAYLTMQPYWKQFASMSMGKTYCL
jgi:hypothetical protein